MLGNGFSGVATAKFFGVSASLVSRIRSREARRAAKQAPRPRVQRGKYERPYTKEQRARKKGLVRP